MQTHRVISVPVSVIFGSLFTLLTVAGLVGNAVVVVAIAGDAKMRKSLMNLLLLNLAVTDALNLLTTTVEWTHTIALGYPEWFLPAFTCPIARYLECVFLFSSILTQLAVCVERYIAIVYPIHARRFCNRTKIILTICGIWIFVSFLALPYALIHEKRANSRVCANIHSMSNFWHVYKWVEFFSFYFVPCIIFIALYSRVCLVLWAKNKQLYGGSDSVHETKSLYTKMESRSNSGGGELMVTNARADALKMRRNVVKMLVACVSVYFICYSPIQGIFLSKGLFNVNFNPPYESILLMNALAMTCSACNPLLYTLFSKRFRARIAKILGCSIPGCEHAKEAKTREIIYSFVQNTNRSPNSSFQLTPSGSNLFTK